MSDQDERAIIRVLNRYAIAIDAGRWDLFDSVFTPDVKLDYPSKKWSDLTEFKSDFEKQHAPYTATQHMMLNHLVDVTGDEAAAITYCSWRLIKNADYLEGSAWYDDQLVRTDKGWLIKSRNCRILWTDGSDAVTGGRGAPTLSGMVADERAGRIAYIKSIDAKQQARA